VALKKKYSNKKESCKVTFFLPKEFVFNFDKVSLVGDFNNWSTSENLFTEIEADGSYSVSVVLESNKEYQFRYLCDGMHWFNEPEADKQVDSYIEGSRNSVIVI